MTGNAVVGSPKSLQEEARAADDAGDPLRVVAEGEREADEVPADRADREVREDLRDDRAGVLLAEKPISRNMNPHCMNITTMPATITQRLLNPTESGE